MKGPGPRLSAGVLTADLTRLGSEIEPLRGKASWADPAQNLDLLTRELLAGASKEV